MYKSKGHKTYDVKLKFAMYVAIFGKKHATALKLADPNITDDNYASVQASKLLKQKVVIELIKDFEEKIQGGRDKIEEKAKEILKELDTISFTDLRKVYPVGTPVGDILAPMGEMARAVSELKINETVVDGKVATRQTDIKFHNKMQALKLYGEHFKLYTQVLANDEDVVRPEIYRLPDNGMSDSVEKDE